MSLGLKEEGREILISRRVLRGNKKGLTLVELIVVIAVLCVITGAMIMALGVGERASGIGSAKTDLQSDVKFINDWIVKDVRQAKIQWLDAEVNEPTTDHIKIDLWEWNSTANEIEQTGYSIEYEYDPSDEILYRRYIDDSKTVSDCTPWDEDPDCQVLNQWNFTQITMSPFYTEYVDETDNSFSNSTMLNNRRLIVVVKKSKTVRNIPLDFIMVQEVKIRNE